ncbi:MAG: hypothetical protein K2O08_03055 [Clostridia bacterium]|nr:hypothetical protein [Clostridia bacterium]
MNYFRILNCEHAVKDPMVCITNFEDLKIGRNKFRICDEFVGSENIKFFPKTAKSDGTPDDFLQNTEMVPIFSPRMRKAIEEAGITGIQYIPIEVEHYNKEKLEGYCIANVLNSVSDALDIDKTIFWNSRSDNGKFTVYIPSIKSEAISNMDIFRLKYDDRFATDYSRFIIVSEKFKSVIAKNKFTGIGFCKIKAD